MIDSFSLALTHGLLLLVAWRLLSRPDLDDDGAAAPDAAVSKKRGWTSGKGRPDA
jgi:hypothetical protein